MRAGVCWGSLSQRAVLALAVVFAPTESTHFIYPEGGENWMAGKLGVAAGPGVPEHSHGSPAACPAPTRRASNRGTPSLTFCCRIGVHQGRRTRSHSGASRGRTQTSGTSVSCTPLPPPPPPLRTLAQFQNPFLLLSNKITDLPTFDLACWALVLPSHPGHPAIPCSASIDERGFDCFGLGCQVWTQATEVPDSTDPGQWQHGFRIISRSSECVLGEGGLFSAAAVSFCPALVAARHP